MIYNLSQALERENFKVRCNQLYKAGKVVELIEKKGQRTTSQNAYLHLILSYFALQYGESMEYCKRFFFKELVNPGIFREVKHDRLIGRVTTLRSSAELTTQEMTEAIERFRDWSSKEAGIYLPAPNEEELVRDMGIEVERQKRYI